MSAKVKICGLRRPEDIAFVNEAKPDYIGFVFAKSRRQVTCEQAYELQKDLDPSILKVGVFVDAPLSEIAGIYEKGCIDVVQLHGNETDEEILAVKTALGCPVIKAVSVTKAEDFLKAQARPADYLLFDYGNGGTGKSFDWSQIPALEKPWFFAGGIDPDNVKEALRYHPYAIDVSSGVETDGVKDREKIRRVVSACHYRVHAVNDKVF
jgi:phosphoribosylanthranilate isomerase